MKKVFIETSVFIRFLTKDDPRKYEDCLALFTAVSEGKIKPYTSNIVIMEIIFILDRHYHFPRAKITDAVEKLYLLRNLTVIEKTDTKQALKLYKQLNIKYGDCLIVSQLAGGMKVVTYDSDFRKINKLLISDPAKVITDK